MAGKLSTGGSRITASGNDDFHWSLALTALKSASKNVSRTATIEVVCTSAIGDHADRDRHWLLECPVT
jgi:hypothetical protein